MKSNQIITSSIIASPLEDTTLKFLYGRAFRAPSMQEQIGSPPTIRGGGSSLDPELVDKMETIEIIDRQMELFQGMLNKLDQK